MWNRLERKCLVLGIIVLASVNLLQGASTGWSENPGLALAGAEPNAARATPGEDLNSIRDSAEVESRPYLPALKDGRTWRESAALETMKRWLHNHVRLNPYNNYRELLGNLPEAELAKRNGGGYMCHFKLCQLGASNSGKRRWLPSYD